MMENSLIDIRTFGSPQEIQDDVPNFIENNPISKTNYKRLIGDYNFGEEVRCCFMKENGMLIANTFDELHARLPGIQVEVPPRAAGRKRESEIYSIVRLLGTLPRAPSDFPLRLTKRERPDFLVQCGARTIGVEHTEAISENAAKEAFLRSKGHGPKLHFMRPASISEPRKSSQQLISEIEANHPGPGWAGDSVERGWATAMAHFVTEKLVTANRTGFERFEENWLLIHDNWPAPALEREEGLMLLRTELQAIDPWRVFNRIFALDEKVLLEVSADAAIFHRVNLQ